MNRLETREGFADMLRELQDYAGVPIRQVARMLEVNEKTVRNWLEGYSQPDPSTLIKLFRVLNVPMIPFLKARADDLEKASGADQARKALHDYIDNVASASDLRNLCYALTEVHGSSASSVLVEIACNMSTSMHHRHQVADLVYTNYMYDVAQGSAIHTVEDEDLTRFREAIQLGRDAAMRGEDSYSQMW